MRFSTSALEPSPNFKPRRLVGAVFCRPSLHIRIGAFFVYYKRFCNLTLLSAWSGGCINHFMATVLDISDRIASRLIQHDYASARHVVSAVARTAKLNGDFPKARLAASVSARLQARHLGKGQWVDIWV